MRTFYAFAGIQMFRKSLLTVQTTYRTNNRNTVIMINTGFDINEINDAFEPTH